jgi:cell division protein FtsL
MRELIVLILSAAVFGSALGVVVKRQESRVLATELHRLQSERRLLKQGRSQLLLQQSSLSSHSRIEKLARHSIGMIAPPTTTVVNTK